MSITADWQKKASLRQKEFGQLLQKKNKPALLPKLETLTEEAYSKIDCLQCGACCKNYSPRFKTPDIKRISKHLKMKEGGFIQKYLLLDPDGDFVVNTKPCPFLGPDNFCGIYEQR